MPVARVINNAYLGSLVMCYCYH